MNPPLQLFNWEEEKRANRPTHELQPIFGAYFHSFCDAHDDLVYTKGKEQIKLEVGIHDVIVYSTRAKLYYWRDEDERGRGLVVIPNTDAERDAIEKYNAQAKNL